MLLWTILKVALRSLWANKLRSFLAMLGIIIGVGSVISMLALGAGAQADALKQITAMGTNLLSVQPESRSRSGVMTETPQDLTLEDAAAIVAGVPGIQQLSPVVQGGTQLKYYGQNVRSQVSGVAATYFLMRNFEIARGRTFTEFEADRAAHVAVLGATTAESLFGRSDPLGQPIKLKGLNFTVVGVLKAKGEGWSSPDAQALIPFTTAMKQVFGVDRLREVGVQCADGVSLDQVQTEIETLLRRRHRIEAGKENDFSVRNQADLIEHVESMMQTFTILLSGIAGISLLVGGIGIMNIMLVTVTERTREIGIRKALGARNRDILRQFLIESVLLSGLGGFFGFVAGIGGARGMSALMQVLVGRAITTIIQPWTVFVSFAVAAAVGIFFGLYPAWRAARLDPIEALRYE